MESHARTVDIMTHNYYDMLYAFHVFRGNYRKGLQIICLQKYGAKVCDVFESGVATGSEQYSIYLSSHYHTYVLLIIFP